MKFQILSSKRKVVTGSFLVSLLLVTFTLMPIVFAEPNTQDITVDTAYSMIEGGAFPDLAILDVRNQREYDVNHLYGTTLIPLHELETRIGELAEQMNNEILVYCGSGGRSEIASGILDNNGFTNVFNILGGITEWIDSEYPIYTTYHNVTVDTIGRHRIRVDIEPWMYEICESCGSQEWSDASELIDVQRTTLEQGEEHTVTLVTYEVNGKIIEFIKTETILWAYEKNTGKSNTTAQFNTTEVIMNNATMQYYSLNYLVQHKNYNVTLYTSLTPLDSETYNNSFTVVNYAPVAQPDVFSLELVNFNSPCTLSQLYNSLGAVAKEVGNVYHESPDETLQQLKNRYYKMGQEIKHLSQIVNRELSDYNKNILNNVVFLVDDFWSCLACTASWTALCYLGCVGLCAAFWAFCPYVGACAELGCNAAVYILCEETGWCP
ncbi:MAG: rhodanese-like domain-containing protein [Candidatus Bathyarchaeota archaeon]|nr:rhodanese-like domain-containing protein [Candidatus Bathyarchaeum tardum]